MLKDSNTADKNIFQQPSYQAEHKNLNNQNIKRVFKSILEVKISWFHKKLATILSLSFKTYFVPDL